jgi:hypothetical protein
LPELGIEKVLARIDTGAATSALHVENLTEFKEKNRNWVSFTLPPDIHSKDKPVLIKARVKGRKKVRNTAADTERRTVIETTLRIGRKSWPIKVTLTDRSGMNYPMLIGREAMVGRMLVDPEFEFLLSRELS